MAALPDWKLQLLERKRKEEEEGRRREKELQERLSKMPTWKRDIIERRRAKLGSGASFPEFGEGGGGFPQHGGSFQGPGFAPAGEGEMPTRGCPEEMESSVLQEKIGPVHQNPFIKLEKQRKESSEGDAGAKARQMADLYSQLPGVRTIRTENIIIIESDPQFFQLEDHREESKSKSVEALNSVMSGGNVREIDTNEVLIIKSSLSRSVEDLNSINRSQDDGGGTTARGRPRKGQVSKLLSKFGQGKSGWTRPARSLSTENITDKVSRDSYDEAFSAEPDARHGVLRWEANGQHEVNNGEVDSPTAPSSLPSPTTPNARSLNDPRRSPLPVAPDEGRARGHIVSPSRSLSPQYKVTSFLSQLKAKSLEVAPSESPCTSPSFPSPLTPRPWQKDLLRHVEMVEEAWQNMAPVPTHKDRATPVGETTPPRSPTGVRNSNSGAHGMYLFHSLADEEDEGLIPEENSHGTVRVAPASPAPLTDPHPMPQQKDNEAGSPPRSTCHRNQQIPEEGAAVQVLSGALCPALEAPTPNLKHAVLDSTSLNDSFEIRAAPAPDLSLIPEDDLQGMALANLRLQSKNSFVIVPRRLPTPPPDLSPATTQEAGSLRKPAAPCPTSCPGALLCAEPASAVLCTEPAAGRPAAAKNVPSVPRAEVRSPDAGPAPHERADQAEPSGQDRGSMSRLYTLKALPAAKTPTPRLEDGRPTPFSVRKPGAFFYQPDRAAPHVVPASAAKGAPGVEAARNLLNRGGEDGVQGERGPLRAGAPAAPPPAASSPETRAKSSHPAMQRRSGNTITINPRKPPAAILENGGPAVAVETMDAAARTEAPRAHQLKKRYPTAEEIQVIGGYQALERSCLAKSEPHRRKMELSFSESDLERIFEYPSEGSLLEEFGPPDEGDAPPPNAQVDDDDEEEVLMPQNGLAGSRSVGNIMRTKPLIVDESCRR